MQCFFVNTATLSSKLHPIFSTPVRLDRQSLNVHRILSRGNPRSVYSKIWTRPSFWGFILAGNAEKNRGSRRSFRGCSNFPFLLDLRFPFTSPAVFLRFSFTSPFFSLIRLSLLLVLSERSLRLRPWPTERKRRCSSAVGGLHCKNHYWLRCMEMWVRYVGSTDRARVTECGVV